ncbi:MAG: ATP-binding protein [Bacteroidales bacterium]|nr:ATP-binding protein [Bacteroidales bacterium]
MKENKKEIRLRYGQDYLNPLEKFIDEICDYFNINNTYFGNITVALTEAVENALVHGNDKDPAKFVTISFRKQPYGLSFTVKDEGSGFDYQSIPDPEHESGQVRFPGKGVFLIKTLADEVRFHEGGSRIEIIFKTASINHEMAVDRIKKLEQYSKTMKRQTS